MKTLDRYILRQFLTNFFILSFVLMGLFILADLLIEMDEFIDAANTLAARRGGFLPALAWCVFDFYYPFVPLMYGYLSGLLVVGAMGFTFAALTRAGETGAMMASGISLYRVAAPVLVAGCVMSAASLPIQEFIVPRLAQKLARSKNHMKHEGFKDFIVKDSPDGKGALLSASMYSPVKTMLTDVTIKVRDSQGQTTRRITADTATWDAAHERWNLVNGRALVSSGAAIGSGASPSRRSEPQAHFATDLSPKVLMARRASIYPRLLSLRELRVMMESPAVDRQVLQQIMNGRFSLMAVNVLILVMTVPYFLSREPQNLMVAASRAALVAIGSWGGALILLQGGGQFDASMWEWLPGLLGEPVRRLLQGLSNPVTAAWLPVAIYLPASAWRLMGIRT